MVSSGRETGVVGGPGMSQSSGGPGWRLPGRVAGWDHFYFGAERAVLPSQTPPAGSKPSQSRRVRSTFPEAPPRPLLCCILGQVSLGPGQYHAALIPQQRMTPSVMGPLLCQDASTGAVSSRILELEGGCSNPQGGRCSSDPQAEAASGSCSSQQVLIERLWDPLLVTE